MKEKMLFNCDQSLKKLVFLCPTMLDPCRRDSDLTLATIEDANLTPLDLPEYLIKHTSPLQSPIDPEIKISDSNPHVLCIDGPNSFCNNKNHKLTIGEEVQTYLAGVPSMARFQPLEFWDVHQKKFPTLICMAQTYPAVPTSSVPSKRSFSNGSWVMSELREGMTSDMLATLVCLKSWGDYMT